MKIASVNFNVGLPISTDNMLMIHNGDIPGVKSEFTFQNLAIELPEHTFFVLIHSARGSHRLINYF